MRRADDLERHAALISLVLGRATTRFTLMDFHLQATALAFALRQTISDLVELTSGVAPRVVNTLSIAIASIIDGTLDRKSVV